MFRLKYFFLSLFFSLAGCSSAHKIQLEEKDPMVSSFAKNGEPLWQLCRETDFKRPAFLERSLDILKSCPEMTDLSLKARLIELTAEEIFFGPYFRQHILTKAEYDARVFSGEKNPPIAEQLANYDHLAFQRKYILANVKKIVKRGDCIDYQTVFLISKGMFECGEHHYLKVYRSLYQDKFLEICTPSKGLHSCSQFLK